MVEFRIKTGYCLLHIFILNASAFKGYLLKSGVIDGYDIRTIQEILGHRNLQTTMIYTHIAKRNVLGAKSPLDRS